MPHKGKVPVEEKMRIVASSLSGEIGYTNAALEAIVDKATFRRWRRRYS